MTQIYLGTAILLGETPAPVSVAQSLIAAAAGLFLLAGLWTPVTAILAALDQIWIALSLRSSPGGGTWIHILLAVLSTSVSMLGPGAWSIDARLFGRRRFPSHRTDGRRPSS
jgi:putative oxidoreductase